jgi:glutathione synthase
MKKKILAIQGSDLKKINIKTDTTLFLATEAQKRGYQILYFYPNQLSFLNGKILAECQHIKLFDNCTKFYKIVKKIDFDLAKAKCILIRNDPPFNQQYINTTFFLEHLSSKVRIINNPSAVRNVAEKLFSIRLMKYMPPTLISENLTEIKKFIKIHKKVIIKPINGYGGNEVVLLKSVNIKIIKKYLKKFNHVIFQKFLPGIFRGDKRVFILNGKIKGCITRVPKKGSILSNMSKGAVPINTVLTKKEKKISYEVAKLLKKNNIYFAGIDFIQGKLIGDINVTSPTGLAAYRDISGINLADYFWNHIYSK